jgi:hypothetical protein
MIEYYVFRNRGAFETSHDWDLTSYDVNGLRTRLDVSFLPPGVQSGAVIDGAEALWPLAVAAHAVTALDDTGNRILGLDVRDYDVDGTFFEISWADVSESDDPPSAAIASLTRSDIPGDWILRSPGLDSRTHAVARPTATGATRICAMPPSNGPSRSASSGSTRGRATNVCQQAST